jgi:nonsense-mediated mRNA decay protein 3
MVRSIEGKRPEYYEAILQLREIKEEVIEYAENEIVKVKLTVAKKTKLKNGVDYQLSDNELTRALGKRLQQRFGGNLKVTASLHTRKNNKDLYRVTVLFRGIDFKKGDQVKYQGDRFKVRSLMKDVFLQEIKTGKKVHVRFRDIDQIKLEQK